MGHLQRSFPFDFPGALIDRERVHVHFAAKAYTLCKACFFGDDEVFSRVLVCRKPSEVEILEEKIGEFDEDVIEDSFKRMFLFSILKAKFSSCGKIKSTLLCTGQKIIAYASRDPVYGIGLDSSDERCGNPEKWLGRNILGECLMEVRSALRGE